MLQREQADGSHLSVVLGVETFNGCVFLGSKSDFESK